MAPDREPIQAFGIGDREHVAGQGIRGVGGGFVRLVARAVAASVDDDDAVIAPEFVDVARLAPPRSIAPQAVQEHERPTLARHVVADPDPVIRDLGHELPPSRSLARDPLLGADLTECSRTPPTPTTFGGPHPLGR
jgi:hypothetical protein